MKPRTRCRTPGRPRRAARTRLFTDDVAFVDFVDETHGTIEQPNVMRIDLERAIERLADNQRLVLVLFDIEGFTHQDTARQLGIAVGTSKATLSRARTILRSILTALPFLRSARLRSMSVTNLRDGTERTYINSAN